MLTADIDGGRLISTDLEHAQEPDHLLQVIKGLGFSDEDIAQATSTQERTVRRWKNEKDGGPGPAATEHLAELRNLMLLFREEDVLTDRGAVYWLRHPNRLLEDYRPLAVIGAGGFRSVRGAALCFCDSELEFTEPLSDSVVQNLRRAESAESRELVGAGG
jgi:hypothetical protein